MVRFFLNPLPCVSQGKLGSVANTCPEWNRWNHSFASYFTTFNDFLAFGWGAIVVTDKKTGRGHVAIRSASPDAHAGSGNGGQGALGGTVQQFARMIKVRFGESLPKLPNQVRSSHPV